MGLVLFFLFDIVLLALNETVDFVFLFLSSIYLSVL